MMKEHKKELRPTDGFQKNEKNQSNDTEKTAFIAGPSYDFWNSEGDSIYDKLYGEEV